MTFKIRIIAFVAAALLTGTVYWSAVSCSSVAGTDSNTGEGTDTQTITIAGMSFSPLTLDAAPGETITVVNAAAVAHTVTSESAEDAFDDSGDFDTGSLSSGGEGSITIPADATADTDLFFYCEIHKGGMDTPNGTIHIVAP